MGSEGETRRRERCLFVCLPPEGLGTRRGDAEAQRTTHSLREIGLFGLVIDVQRRIGLEKLLLVVIEGLLVELVQIGKNTSIETYLHSEY